MLRVVDHLEEALKSLKFALKSSLEEGNKIEKYEDLSDDIRGFIEELDFIIRACNYG